MQLMSRSQPRSKHFHIIFQGCNNCGQGWRFWKWPKSSFFRKLWLCPLTDDIGKLLKALPLPICVQNLSALGPNKLCCIIKFSKLSTYYVRSGSKMRPGVECHYMASIYYKHEDQPNFRRHISDFREDLGPMGLFQVPWALRGRWLSYFASRAKGLSYWFWIMKIGRGVSKAYPGQIGPLIVDPRDPRSPHDTRF